MSPLLMFPSLAILLVLLGSLSFFLHILRHQKKGQKLPPGPRPLPIIGNLHILTKLPHRTLDHLAKVYGDIMLIRLGMVPTIVVSSPQAAELFLKTHDAVFAHRPKFQFPLHMSPDGGMAFLYGSHSRHVRKLCTSNLLSAAKIEAFGPLMREELRLAVGWLRKAAAAGEVVDIRIRVGELFQHMICKMVFGPNYEDEVDLIPVIKEFFSMAAVFNIADYVPFLEPFDLQGLTRRMTRVRNTMDKVLERIIAKREQEAHHHHPQKHQQMDFIDVLLSMTNQPLNPHDDQIQVLDRLVIKSIIMGIVAGGFDTSPNIIEWIISELMRHPRVMKKLQRELETVVGTDRMVEETDLPKLKYLDMVIKESFRLHPNGPFLVPRECAEDVTINGYHIPKKSRIFINVWTIGRDVNTWSDNAQEFHPERFEDTNMDLRGRDFQLLPFGSGRRMCPGILLGLTSVQLVVAQLMHCFDWELPKGMSPSELDMTEKFVLALEKASHLLIVPTYRLQVN